MFSFLLGLIMGWALRGAYDHDKHEFLDYASVD